MSSKLFSCSTFVQSCPTGKLWEEGERQKEFSQCLLWLHPWIFPLISLLPFDAVTQAFPPNSSERSSSTTVFCLYFLCMMLLHESLLRAMGRDLSFQQTGFEQELNGFLVVIKSEIETVNSSLVYMNEDSTVSRSWLPESLQDVNQ